MMNRMNGAINTMLSNLYTLSSSFSDVLVFFWGLRRFLVHVVRESVFFDFGGDGIVPTRSFVDFFAIVQ